MQFDFNSLDLDTTTSHKKNGKSHPHIAGEITELTSIQNEPKISVIIPVLQEEKLLEATLKCYTKEICYKYNVELIVSDGGSKDRTIEIAEKYADIVVKHENIKRQTIADGRNKGAEAAKGDVLVFINGDTVPKDIESFFAYIRNWTKQTDVKIREDALACPVSVAPDEIIFRDKLFHSTYNTYVRFLNFIGMGMGRGECQIVRAEAFKKVKGYNSLIAAGEDFDLYQRIKKIGRIGFAGELIVYESPRRFRKFGYIRVVSSWLINSVAVMVFGKSVSSEWEAVR